MDDGAHFVLAQYLPDPLRREARNVGVIVWTPTGIGARFLGERAGAPGRVDEKGAPAFVASLDAYVAWVRYWRRELEKGAIRAAHGARLVARTDRSFLDALASGGPSNYTLAAGGTIGDLGGALDITATVEHLFNRFVLPPGTEEPPPFPKRTARRNTTRKKRKTSA
jgi:hypothetical protein